MAYLKIRSKIDKSNKDKDSRGRVIFKDAPLVTDVFNSSLTSICVEEGFVSKKKERTYIVGTTSGAIIQYRPASSWYKKKIIVLFDGANTPVDAISWRGKIIAWADSRHIRLMCVSNQTALCFINAPKGLPMDSAASSSFCPCSLYWESNSRLLIGWGDSFKQVDLYHDSGGMVDNDNSRDGYGSISSNNSSAGNKSFDETGAGGMKRRGDVKESGLVDVTAKVTSEWQCGFIICRVAVLDCDHIAVVGFQPPNDEILSKFYDSSTSPTDYPLYPTMCVVRRSDGCVMSMDIVPVGGCNMDNFRSPHDFRLISSYKCSSHRSDYMNWNLTSSTNTSTSTTTNSSSSGAAVTRRGGTRGMSPVLYLISGGNATDIVVIRLKDTIDRIAGALSRKDLRSALEIANADRAALTAPSCESAPGLYDSLVTLYLEDLLERSVSVSHCPVYTTTKNTAEMTGISGTVGGAHDPSRSQGLDPAAFAVSECVRLIGHDVSLWEHYIGHFTHFGHLSALVRHIPIDKLLHPKYRVNNANIRLNLDVIEVCVVYNSY